MAWRIENIHTKCHLPHFNLHIRKVLHWRACARAKKKNIYSLRCRRRTLKNKQVHLHNLERQVYRNYVDFDQISLSFSLHLSFNPYHVKRKGKRTAKVFINFNDRFTLRFVKSNNLCVNIWCSFFFYINRINWRWNTNQVWWMNASKNWWETLLVSHFNYVWIYFDVWAMSIDFFKDFINIFEC